MSITSLHHALLGCKKSKQRDNCQKEPKIFIYGASVEYITVWFQIVPVEVQTIARSLCQEELPLSGAEAAPWVLQVFGEGGYTRGPAVGFPSAMCTWVLMELCDAMETSANAAAGEVRVFIQQSQLALPHEVCSVPYTYREIRLCK